MRTQGSGGLKCDLEAYPRKSSTRKHDSCATLKCYYIYSSYTYEHLIKLSETMEPYLSEHNEIFLMKYSDRMPHRLGVVHVFTKVHLYLQLKCFYEFTKRMAYNRVHHHSN